jgi:hypothetical protein
LVFLSSGIVPSIQGHVLTFHGNQMQVDPSTRHYLLAIPVGIKQKDNVDHIVQKVLQMSFLMFLFHQLNISCLISLNSVSSREFYSYSISL